MVNGRPPSPLSIDLVLPALNEAEALRWVLPRVPDAVRAIVVDNGSTDGTVSVASMHGAKVVLEPQRGFGAACFAGLSASDAEIVVFCDADASIDPGDLWQVVDPIVRREMDLVMGARVPDRTGAWPAHARIANRFLASRVRAVTGAAITDMGPLRAARRTDLLDLGIIDRRFGWPLEMVLRAGLAGWRLGEVPIAYRPRIGRSKVTGTALGTARAVRDMSRILRSVRTVR